MSGERWSRQLGDNEGHKAMYKQATRRKKNERRSPYVWKVKAESERERDGDIERESERESER